MRKSVTILAAIIIATNLAFSQGTAINSTGAAADSSAMLDVSSNDKGVLIPRINLQSTTDATTIPLPATGLLVYNTNAVITNGAGVGFYSWDGSLWIPILQPTNSGGTSGQIIMSDASGAPVWSSPACFKHYVGEQYGGGVVFEVYYSGGAEHGLIVSPTEPSGAIWTTASFQAVSVPTCAGCTGCDAGSVGAQSSWNGMCNTYAVLDQNSNGSCASLTCKNYNGGGYTDWYLPSIDELNKLTEARMEVNKTLGASGIAQDYYWSSTEYDAGSAWVYNMGAVYTNGKGASRRVRPIRAFS